MKKLKRNPNCKLCPLHQTAEYVCLLGKGPIPSDIMVIGEAPGHREDSDGKPFVGKAGKLLDGWLDDAGIPRKSIYITNAVHCRPPNNRTPKMAEIRACQQWIYKEIQAVRPKYVLLLGRVPILSVLGIKDSLKNLRGSTCEKDDIIFYFSYHPAYALHNPGAETRIQQDIKKFGRLVKGTKTKDKLSIRIVETEREFDNALIDIAKNKVLSSDIEGTGLNPWAEDASIISFGIGTKDHQWIWPIDYEWKGSKGAWYGRLKYVVSRVKRAVRGKILVGQAWKFDQKYIRALSGVNIPCQFDTLLAHYQIDENSPHDLNYLSAKYCDAEAYDIPLHEKQGNAPFERIARYHGYDLYYTRRLYFKLKLELEKDPDTQRIYQEITLPLTQFYADVERNGFYVDPDKHKKALIDWTKKRDKIVKKLNRRFPSDNKWKDKKTKEWKYGVNWNSPQQIGEILFDKLGLEPIELTKAGANSTNESVLIRLADEHPVPKLILSYREANTLLNTFLGPWGELLKSGSKNIIHHNFKIHGTVTGRPSCEEPNLQQTPRESTVRPCISAPDGWVLVEADYSQIELRIVAEMSRDERMMEAFYTGEDIHTLTVQWSFGIQDPTEDQRKRGKAVNFGYIYGMWWPKFQRYAKDKYGIDFTDQECISNRKSFFRLYNGLPGWHRRQKRFAAQHGYVKSLIGRKRRLPDAMRDDDSYECKEAGRQAINAPVQSCASDMNLKAGIVLKSKLPRKWYRPVGTVHDNILAWARKEAVDEVCYTTKKVMEDKTLLHPFDFEFSVPIIAEVKIGPWGAGKKWKYTSHK